jgi:kynureninase
VQVHRQRAEQLDQADPLATFRQRFLPSQEVLTAYFDGNSLGRPLVTTADAMKSFIQGPWGTGLIRSWDATWLDWPLRMGDDIARIMLGAAPGQVIVADSTTVLLYKLLHAACAANPGRSTIVIEEGNFPTDRYIAEAIAHERGLKLRWISPADGTALQPADVATALDTSVATVLLSHISYLTAAIADMVTITSLAHGSGASVIWDLSHSAGLLPLELDAAGVDYAVGCTYKYLNGGPGSPAFAYVKAEHLATLSQPIWGWLGRKDAFEMEPGYVPTDGIRRLTSGTPPILAMVPLAEGIALIEEAGIKRIREKSTALTEFALEVVNSWPKELGFSVNSPRDSALRGGHITLLHTDARAMTRRLWGEGVIPDYRNPDGIRIGLSPLSTSFAEVEAGLNQIRNLAQ